MIKAIISDIHGNLEALQAVLADIESRGNTEIICLGDIIGYGPNPRECLKLARQHFNLTLKGNHEEALLYLGLDFRKVAVQAIDWTREEINSPQYDQAETDNFWDYLGGLVERSEIDDHIFLHGSPRDPTREYLHPEDIRNVQKIRENFDLIKHTCFCGHTHQSGIFVLNPEGKVVFLHPRDINYTYEIGENKCIINVGAVGQPRDGDNRACYVTLEDKQVTFHRVAYDYKMTMLKIVQTKRLPLVLAKRLQLGR